VWVSIAHIQTHDAELQWFNPSQNNSYKLAQLYSVKSYLTVMLTDDAWEAVLETLKQEGAFRIEDLPFDGGERVSVAIMLRRFERRNWVRKEGELWLPDEKAQRLLDLDDSKPVGNCE